MRWEDLGIETKGWKKTLTISYAARDPRDPRYCENELLHVMVAKHDGPLYMNEKNAYAVEWTRSAEIAKYSEADLKKEPIERKYAPWVHAVFTLPAERVEESLAID